MALSRASRVSGFLLEHFSPLAVDLGTLESWWYRHAVAQQVIDRPVYICGLARSGSTTLLEVLAQSEATASFCYADFPFVHTPIWWKKIGHGVLNSHQRPQERAHQDRIQVTPNSPEAMEEILWMHFFPQCHDPSMRQTLEAKDQQEAFNLFYQHTIRKLLIREGASRYLAKGNYNICRVEYLAHLFPEARFVIPVRHPFAQVASLVKQHRLFVDLERADPPSLAYMRQVGHFEFGLDRRALNTGHPQDSLAAQQAFEQNNDVAAYARQWQTVYAHADRLRHMAHLKDCIRLVRYEDLCAEPFRVLTALHEWLALPVNPAHADRWSQTISAPDYYQSPLTAADETTIEAITREAGRAMAYFD